MKTANNSGRTIKPGGGIEAVRLIPISGIDSVQISNGKCTGITLRKGAESIEWPILEDRSSYREELLCDNGIPRIRHILTLVCDPEEVRNQEALWETRMAEEGVAARIETTAGTTLLTGWSERFKKEQPLRLQEKKLDTGEKPLARPTLTLFFTSEDTASSLLAEEA